MSPRLRNGLHQALFGWLNFALTAPSVYLWLGLPLLMRQQGWSGTAIGVFQLAGLPAVFKVFLATPVERYRPRQGHYKGWGMMLCVLYATVLCAMGWQDLLSHNGWLFGLALCASLAATWADIPVNALAIRLLPASHHMRAGAIRSGALSLGAIAGGGLMLLAQARWGWQAPFVCMAGALLLGAALLAFVHEDGQADDTATLLAQAAPSFKDRCLGYLRQPGAMRWTLLLMSYFPFIGAAWFYLKPLLLDNGFAATQAALLAGVGGGIVAACGAAASPVFTRRLGLARALPLFALLNCSALMLLTLAVGAKVGAAGLAGAALLVAAAMGMSSACVFGLMMRFARPQTQAFDYGLQASLFAFTRLVTPLAAGLLLDVAGAVWMLAALSLAALAVIIQTLGLKEIGS
ncbi:MAG: MFS transporter [Rhodoferax sp.]|nr:MFS transporter [Rhodoferax sp.]